MIVAKKLADMATNSKQNEFTIKTLEVSKQEQEHALDAFLVSCTGLGFEAALGFAALATTVGFDANVGFNDGLRDKVLGCGGGGEGVAGLFLFAIFYNSK